VLKLHNGVVCNRIQLKDTFLFSYYASSHVWCSATSIFNILIIYHSLNSVREPSLSLLQVACNFHIQHINNLSFFKLSQGAFSLLQALCNFGIQHINNLSFLKLSQGAFSLLQAVCNFCIQQNNNLSFLILSQGAFSLLQAVCNF